MGWGTKPEDVWPYLPRQARAVEAPTASATSSTSRQPEATAELVLEHLAEAAA